MDAYVNLYEAPLCTQLIQKRKGSFTVEAAIVLPVFVWVLVLLLSWFRIFQVERSVQTALTLTGQRIAAEGTLGNDLLDICSAEYQFHQAIKDNPYVEKYVKDEGLGLSLLESTWDEHQMNLTVRYTISLPLMDYSVTQKSIHKKWNGLPSDFMEKTWVYVAKKRSVYHTHKDCKYLNVIVKKTGYENRNLIRTRGGARFKPCQKCVKGKKSMKTIYYGEGTSYHFDPECGNLKCYYRLVDIEECKDLRQCYECSKRDGLE